MTRDTTPIFPHGSREGCFPYMSASTYFPLQHQCWLKSSLHPACGLALMLSPRAWNQPMLSPTNQTDSWLPVLNTCCWLARPSFTRGQPRFPFLSVPGPGLKGLALRGLPPILKSWGSRAWSCLPLAWWSSFSWQFSSSLASWSPCPHLKVRAHLRPLKWLTDT